MATDGLIGMNSIEFVGTHHRFPQPQLLIDEADAGQAVHPLGVIVFGHQLGSLPHPVELVEPTPHRFRRHPDTALGLQGGSQRGTAPAGATPPIDAGTALSSATSDRRSVGASTVVGTGGRNCPWASRSRPKLYAR